MHERGALALLVVGVTVLMASTAYAAVGTPLDGMFSAFMGSVPLWGRVIIMVGGIGLALVVLYALNAGPMVLMYVVIGFIVLTLIGLSANGTIASWIMGV